MSAHTSNSDIYYVPAPSSWPFLMTVSMTIFMVGFTAWLNGAESGSLIFFAGLACILAMSFIWLRGVIKESETGAYNMQVDRTYRWSMGWFIFSEVMFFGAFFGALYYARQLSLPWLAGEGSEFATNEYLWNNWEFEWPSNGPSDVGGDYDAMPPWDLSAGASMKSFWGSLPLINTLILLTSGVTCTFAHHALKHEQRVKSGFWLLATVALGCTFLGFQAYEYSHAYQEMNLTLGSGIYGSTFFMLTGFHGAHVTLGTLMLFIIMLRCFSGHFTQDRHFGFEGVAWYWHFVDVVWLGLFIFVYVL